MENNKIKISKLFKTELTDYIKRKALLHLQPDFVELVDNLSKKNLTNFIDKLVTNADLMKNFNYDLNQINYLITNSDTVASELYNNLNKTGYVGFRDFNNESVIDTFTKVFIELRISDIDEQTEIFKEIILYGYNNEINDFNDLLIFHEGVIELSKYVEDHGISDLESTTNWKEFVENHTF